MPPSAVRSEVWIYPAGGAVLGESRGSPTSLNLRAVSLVVKGNKLASLYLNILFRLYIVNDANLCEDTDSQ